MHVDLNADAGESFGAWTLGTDSDLLTVVTSVNIACGFHAGDPSVIRKTVRMAAAAATAIGAHPGFSDLQGFGRRDMHMSPADVEDLVLYQVAALAGIARAEGTALRHVKPHGALYNMAARDESLAAAIARAVHACDPGLRLVGLAGSRLIDAGVRLGLAVAAEAFADRAYRADGSLASRSLEGAVMHDPAVVAARAVRMVTERRVATLDGTDLAIAPDTLCIHGDTPGAPALARAVRDALERAGVIVRPLGASASGAPASR